MFGTSSEAVHDGGSKDRVSLVSQAECTTVQEENDPDLEDIAAVDESVSTGECCNPDRTPKSATSRDILSFSKQSKG